MERCDNRRMGEAPEEYLMRDARDLGFMHMDDVKMALPHPVADSIPYKAEI